MMPQQSNTPPSIDAEMRAVLSRLGVGADRLADRGLTARSPITGERIGQVWGAMPEAVSEVVDRSANAFRTWRDVPAPQRGELVRLLGEELRAAKADLGRLVTLEAGKIVSEGLGEVQEMIDICDFAVGLSRQLYGRTIATERPMHRMMETWHPLGPVAVITSFNFPVAVWAWNTAIAIVCGNPVIWKPSDKTPLTALATTALFNKAAQRFGAAPDNLCQLLPGDREVGQALAGDRRIPLVSATGSTAMGRAVASVVAQRLGRSLLELGGNNAAIVSPTADLDLTLRAVAFSAIGTAGQRCTTLRRLIVHQDIAATLIGRLTTVYGSVAIGDPRQPDTLVGPLIDRAAYDAMMHALEVARGQGASVVGGDRVLAEHWPEAYYVSPALVDMPKPLEIARQETFAPILYCQSYQTLEQAIALHNDVPQGLASSIFTRDVSEAEIFMSAAGSDCGIVNVNIGPSGAEIGGAFGGEKDTGGGRESGSDAWRTYMRRATNTINYGSSLPLAQGVRFDVEG